MLRKLGQQRGRVRRLSREILTITAGQALAVIGSLVGIRILTEVIPPATYGEVKLLAGLVFLANTLIFHPVCLYAMRGFPEAASRSLRREFVAF